MKLICNYMHTLTVRLLYASDCAANDCALADATVSMTWAFDDFLSAEELHVSSRSMLFKSFLEIAIRSNDFLTCKKEEKISNVSSHALNVPQSGMNSKIKLLVLKQKKKKWEIFSFIYVTHVCAMRMNEKTSCLTLKMWNIYTHVEHGGGHMKMGMGKVYGYITDLFVEVCFKFKFLCWTIKRCRLLNGPVSTFAWK